MEVKTDFHLFMILIFLSYLLSLSCAQNFKREKQGVSFAKFVKASSVKLDVSRLASLKVSRVGECTFECVSNQDCYSVNFRASLDGKHSCELLKTDKFRRSSNFVASGEFDHYYIKVKLRKSFRYFRYIQNNNNNKKKTSMKYPIKNSFFSEQGVLCHCI